MLQGIQLTRVSRCEAWPSTSYGGEANGRHGHELLRDISSSRRSSPRFRFEKLGRRCSLRPLCTRLMATACPFSSPSLQLSSAYSPHSFTFRHRCLRQLAAKQSTVRSGALFIVTGQRKTQESHNADGRVSEGYEEGFSEREEPSLQEERVASVTAQPPQSYGGVPMNLAAGVGVSAAVIMMAVLGFLAKPRDDGGGSVSDLVKRGQLRSDRGDGRSLKYEDPFNNPLVKVGGKNPIVRMCGKLFRLAPVTLTDEKRVSHQNRRIQAYQWKRPVVFLSEGEPVPEGVDPEEVRWIPANHPFATTTNYIDEDLAQRNVMQTRGVPSRVKAEHDALRKKMMEAASKEPEFQFPDSSVEQWGTPPGADEDGVEKSEGDEEGRWQLDRRRSSSGINGSSRLRGIDGSEGLGESPRHSYEGQSDSQ